MAANKKPRKKYRPRQPMLDPLGYVLKGMKPMTPDQILASKIQLHEAQAKLAKGNATHSDFETVKFALNISAALSASVYDRAYLDDIHAAMVAMANCGYRLIKHGKYGYSGTDLQAVNHALEIYDAQIEQATMQEINVAIKLVDRSIRMKNFVALITKDGVKDERPKQAQLSDMGSHKLSSANQRLVGPEQATA